MQKLRSKYRKDWDQYLLCKNRRLNRNGKLKFYRLRKLKRHNCWSDHTNQELKKKNIT